jgi:hypothetical protein
MVEDVDPDEPKKELPEHVVVRRLPFEGRSILRVDIDNR